MKKQRVSFFIDGFNLYHSINDTGKDYLKWLNLKLLCKNFIDLNNQEISTIYYFSAYADWLNKSVSRHKVYIDALNTTNIKVVLGKFKEKTIKCKKCNEYFQTHEEKETDVNIAIHILRDALNDGYDKAIILSADSDFAPAIRMARQICPQKQFSILTPIGRRHGRELIQAAGKSKNKKHPSIKLIHLERALFPQEIITEHKKIVRPEKYIPPLD